MRTVAVRFFPEDWNFMVLWLVLLRLRFSHVKLEHLGYKKDFCKFLLIYSGLYKYIYL